MPVLVLSRLCGSEMYFQFAHWKSMGNNRLEEMISNVETLWKTMSARWEGTRTDIYVRVAGDKKKTSRSCYTSQWKIKVITLKYKKEGSNWTWGIIKTDWAELFVCGYGFVGCFVSLCVCCWGFLFSFFKEFCYPPRC